MKPIILITLLALLFSCTKSVPTKTLLEPYANQSVSWTYFAGPYGVSNVTSRSEWKARRHTFQTHPSPKDDEKIGGCVVKDQGSLILSERVEDLTEESRKNLVLHEASYCVSKVKELAE